MSKVNEKEAENFEKRSKVEQHRKELEDKSVVEYRRAVA